MSALCGIKDLINYLRHHKLAWILPLAIVLLVLLALVLLSQTSALTPFMYQ
jgi:hypothetical protein